MTLIHSPPSLNPPDQDMSSSFILEPFVGFDYRRSKHLGFRLECRYQLLDKPTDRFPKGFKASLGFYGIV